MKKSSIPSLTTPRPYFPMLLGNGADHVLIGYTGAMGGGGSHEQWCYDHAVITGWFKSDRRGADRRKLNLLQCGCVVRGGLRARGIESFEQTFDPHTAVLHTIAHYGRCIVRVQTLLTAGHRLVHQFDVSPHGDDLSLQMYIRAPGYWWLAAKTPHSVELDVTPGRSHLDFTVRSPTISGMRGRLTCDAPEARATDTFARAPGIDVPLRGRSRFTITLELTDDIDRQLDVPKNDGPVVHRRQWRRYAGRSGVTLPDHLQSIYDVSLYACRAHQHPQHGGVTVGEYPLMWYCDINPFDMGFPFMAFLTANRLDEAHRVLHFWRQALPKMQQLAASIGATGACSMATMNQRGDLVDVLPDDPAARRAAVLDTKHFITAHAPLDVWQAYLHTGDPKVLTDNWSVMDQPVRFLLNHAVVEQGDAAEIIRSSGPNGKERINGKSVHHPNPTRTLEAVIEAVKAIRAAADVLGKPHDPAWDRLLPKLIRGIEHNRVNGVVGRNREMHIPHVDPCMVGLFNAPVDRRTILAAMRRERSTEGFPHWPDHGYRVVPWLELRCATIQLRMKHPAEGVAHIERAAFHTTTLGAFPEGVRPDGVFWKTWYATVHGAFVHAVNQLLLRRGHQDDLYILRGVPAAWGDVSFTNLRAPLGLRVSASRRGRRFAAEIHNESDQLQRLTVHLGKSNAVRTVTVEPAAALRISSGR